MASLAHFLSVAPRLKLLLDWVFADRVGLNQCGKRKTVLKHMQWKLIQGAHRRTGSCLPTTRPRRKHNQGKVTKSISYWKVEPTGKSSPASYTFALGKFMWGSGAVFHRDESAGLVVPLSLTALIHLGVWFQDSLRHFLQTWPTEQSFPGSDPLSWGPLSGLCLPAGSP